MDSQPFVKIGDLLPAAKREDDGIDWQVVETKNILGKQKFIRKISFYQKDGQDKVFIGFTDDTAIATGSGPVLDQMEKLREALEMQEDELFTPQPVAAILKEIRAKSGRTYLIFQ